MRLLQLIISAVFLLSVAPSLAMATPKKPVDVAIVLAVDVSKSIWQTLEGVDEYGLQKKGIIEALKDPETIAQIENCNPNGVALTYVEWSGLTPKERPMIDTVVNWTHLFNKKSILEFAAQVESAYRHSQASTDIAGAMIHSRKLFSEMPFVSERKIVLMSSDGVQNVVHLSQIKGDRKNYGMDDLIKVERDILARNGISLDALVISNEIPNLPVYFKRNVITPDGLTSELQDFRDYGTHFKKLLHSRLCGLTS